ncbi:MAG: hypothetical protein ACI8RZ_006440 [Myxococcota bacterium]|jgi:hypothetical protein
MRDELALLRRCRSFALQTQGQWSTAARERLQGQLEGRGISGPVDTMLETAAAERTADAVYVCIGSSCVKAPLSLPEGGLPIRQTACLGACQHAPSAHRVIDGVGQTHAALDAALLATLVQGEDCEALRRRRWRTGETFPDPGLEPLDGVLGAWSGPGGFSSIGGCTRSLTARFALGGRFLDLDFVNAWPAVTGGADRYPERLSLQPDDDGFRGIYLGYRGNQEEARAEVIDDALVVTLSERADQRRVLRWTAEGLSERHERMADGVWKASFRAELRRQ